MDGIEYIYVQGAGEIKGVCKKKNNAVNIETRRYIDLVNREKAYFVK